MQLSNASLKLVFRSQVQGGGLPDTEEGQTDSTHLKFLGLIKTKVVFGGKKTRSRKVINPCGNMSHRNISRTEISTTISLALCNPGMV